MSSLRFQEQSLEVWKQETIPLNCYIATKIIQQIIQYASWNLPLSEKKAAKP
jgi:hypothetical protein